MVDKLLHYAITQGPWAVMCLGLGWLWLRTRSESKAAIKELSELVSHKESEIRAIEAARLSQSLELQGKGFESLAKLNQLMDRVDMTLSTVDKNMLSCIKFQDRVKSALERSK